MKGISSIEAKEKLEKFGYNELKASKPKNVFQIAVEVMKEPMFILLISCAVLYMILGDYREGVILLSTIFVIIVITFYQSNKTEKALEALKKLASPQALVIRDEKEVHIPGREVVVDDLVILNEGDRVPADGVMLEVLNLSLDEALLTGESVSVTKQINESDHNGKVFSGTLVVRGKGIFKVTEIGQATEFGKIGESLASIEKSSTRLQKEMKRFIRNLFIIGIIISLGVILLFYFSRGNLVKSLLHGLSASIAILPEEFPVIMTVFLALGSWRLSKVNVLTRSPTAIETLGSATVLCSDKTGTITQNEMEVVALFNGNKTIEKDNFGKSLPDVNELIESAHHASQIDSVDPMEKALTLAFQNLNLSDNASLKLVKEYPFDKEFLAMTRVLQDEENQKLTASLKGAPETVFQICGLSEDDRKKNNEVLKAFAEKGYRVIAVAKTALNKKETLPEKQQDLKFAFQGLVALEDPIRPEVPNAVKECIGAGVKVIMITGDYPATAKSIGEKIGLPKEGILITGEELNKLSDIDLKTKIKDTTIFARVKPEQKLRIVQALKDNGEIVAMTGDGVNDAPALKAAQIGVAMGKKGTDVAREASSLVLLDDNFASIISAIRSGRRIFDNLQKAMSYVLAIHIPIIGLALMPAFNANLPIFLLPLHIVFMELIIDPVCSIVFESEGEEKNIMNRPPRPVEESFFGAKKMAYSLFQGSLLLTMVLLVYYFTLHEGYKDGEVRAIAFSSLIIGNVFLILTDLSRSRSFIKILFEKNWAIKIMIFSVALMLTLILTVPVLQTTFSFQFPGFKHFIPSIAGSFILLLILEIIKFFSYRRANKEAQTK